MVKRKLIITNCLVAVIPYTRCCDMYSNNYCIYTCRYFTMDILMYLMSTHAFVTEAFFWPNVSVCILIDVPKSSIILSYRYHYLLTTGYDIRISYLIGINFENRTKRNETLLLHFTFSTSYQTSEESV